MTKRIVLRLDETVIEQLAALALTTQMSVSDNIRVAIDARLHAYNIRPATGDEA